MTISITQSKAPVIVPIPSSTSGVQNAVMSLNGTWKLNLNPPREFWKDEIDPSSWRDIPVPGYLPSQGILVLDGEEYAYRLKQKIGSVACLRLVYPVLLEFKRL